MLTAEFFEHLAPGKPYGCILYASLDAADDWYDQYEAWQFDKTGKVPPPKKPEEWKFMKDFEDDMKDLEG